MRVTWKVSVCIESLDETYQPVFFHLGECATYQPAINQSDWPVQTVIYIQ